MKSFEGHGQTFTRNLSRRDLLRLLGLTAGTASLAVLAACNEQEEFPQQSASEDSVENTPAPTESVEDVEDTPAPTATETPAERPELVIGVPGLPATLDPCTQLSNAGTRVTYSIFDYLLERDFPSGDPPGTGSGLLPMLATEWERIDDLTLELKLREDVLFHNGDRMTAEDVVFTFERILIDTPDILREALGYVSTITSVEAIDEVTVRLITEFPDPILEKRLASWATWILPKAYHEEVGLDGFAQAPVGTGPYKVVELRPDDQLVLEAFDDYWGGMPPASRVTFRVIPETASRVAALVSGEVDIITNVPPDQLPTLETAQDVEVMDVPLANCHVLRYNTNHPVLANKTLRQAMNLAIDRDLLIETLWSGQAEPMRSHQFPEYGNLYNPDRPYQPYDPEQARQIVEESGYAGEPVIFRTGPAIYTNGLEAAQAIVQMWQDVGINAEVEVRENPYDVPPDEWMVGNWSNSSFVADPDGAFYLRWGGESRTQPVWWQPGPEVERFNELGAEARQTLDEEARYEAYQEMLDIWEDEAPGTVLYSPIELYGVRQGIDWLPYSFYYMDFRPDNLAFS